jgi:hypothetical protein
MMLETLFVQNHAMTRKKNEECLVVVTADDEDVTHEKAFVSRLEH